MFAAQGTALRCSFGFQPFPQCPVQDYGEQIPHSPCSEASHHTAGVQLPSCCQPRALKHKPGRLGAADDPGVCHRPNRCDGKSQARPQRQQKHAGMESDLHQVVCVSPRESSPLFPAHFSGGIRRKTQCSPCSGSRAVPPPHDLVLLQMKDAPGPLHCPSHSRLSTCGTLISAGGSSGALMKRDNRNWRVN